jgi:arylsulfatase A-like enzyme
MLTGRYGFRAGVTQPVGGPGAPGVQTNEFTLPEVIGANPQLGYATASIGKWHLRSAASSPNTASGWPHFSGALGGGLQSYTSWTKTVNGASTPNYSVHATSDRRNRAGPRVQYSTGRSATSARLGLLLRAQQLSPTREAPDHTDIPIRPSSPLGHDFRRCAGTWGGRAFAEHLAGHFHAELLHGQLLRLQVRVSL